MSLIDDRVYIGIDPGMNGGLSIIHGKKVSIHPLPVIEEQLLDFICGLGITYLPEKMVVYLEDIPTASYTFESGGSRGDAITKLYGHYKSVRMALVSQGILFGVIRSKVWQGIFDMKKEKGEDQGKWKKRLAHKALAIFPGKKFGVELADSLLIAEAGRRIHNEKVKKGN